MNSNSDKSNVESRLLVVSSTEDFAKQLMVVLMASIAFTANIVKDSQYESVIWCFIITIVFMALSFITGFVLLSRRIKAIGMEDKNGRITKMTEARATQLIEDLMSVTRRHYLVSAVSMFFLLLSIVLTFYYKLTLI